MPELKATPRGSILGAIADALTQVRDTGDKVRIPLIDMGLGELLLGKTPEEINEWSYGNAPLRVVGGGTGSRVPQLKQGRAQQVLDTMFTVPGVGPLARASAVLPKAVEHGAKEFAHASAAASPRVIKQKGGNWLTNSVEDALKDLKLPISMRAAQMDRELVEAGAGRNPNVVGREAVNKWIEGPLTKYVKRDMATPGDPVRRLAEEGVLHFDPEGMNPNIADAANRMRGVAEGFVRTPGLDFPGVVMSKSPLARAWEDVSDSAVGTQPAGVRKKYEFQVEGSPWLADVPDDTLVYHYNRSGNIGFNHLIDELKNALNHESGLPRNLLLNPEQMQQMGMEKAVRHVDLINKWRAEQMAAKSQSPAVRLFKEYGEDFGPNPKGLRWVELKAPEELPEGWGLGKPTAFGEPTYRKVGSSDDVMIDPRRSLLQDQLTYEGDTMGHCVGGYCDDVTNKGTRIYSLRDAKGEPHVTIEVGQPLGFAGKKSREEYENFIRNHPGTKHTEEEIQQALKDLDKGGAWDERIVQIKGKQNKAPKADYLPFVQDFVKSGKWSEVRDLRNAGLRRTADALSENERRILQSAGHELPDYLTPEQIEALQAEDVFGKALEIWRSKEAPQYASGGLIRGGKVV